ncbi:MAG: phasin family protein [Hyphomicrobiaceae bacterium]
MRAGAYDGAGRTGPEYDKATDSAPIAPSDGGTARAQSPFEIPQQIRDLAEKNVEQARSAYGQFMDAMTQATSMWSKVTPADEMTSGFQAVQERATSFAKQNAEAGFALASDLAKAKDIQEVFSLQSRHAQAQMQAYARPGAGAWPADDPSCREHTAPQLEPAAAGAFNTAHRMDRFEGLWG